MVGGHINMVLPGFGLALVFERSACMLVHGVTCTCMLVHVTCRVKCYHLDRALSLSKLWSVT